MKKALLCVLLVLLLVSCERPATIANWSPINDVTPDALIEQVYPTLDAELLPERFEPSMKGFELVSWQVDEVWVFTIISGTNREKSFDELVSPENEFSQTGLVKITVAGTDQLKMVFDRLSPGEQIIWSGMDLTGQVPADTLYFSYPDQSMMDDLISYCEARDIILISLKEPQ